MSNTSAWLNTLDFTDRAAWNDTAVPADLETGYELKSGVSLNQSLGNGKYHYWDDENPYFTLSEPGYRLNCCGNVTGGNAAIGYWSSAADAKHSSVVVKWLTGHPFANQFTDSENQTHWVWKDVPKVNALNCTPLFETANAKVEVDFETGAVQSYTIVDSPITISDAWSYKYQAQEVSQDVVVTNNEAKLAHSLRNVSVRYVFPSYSAIYSNFHSAMAISFTIYF